MSAAVSEPGKPGKSTLVLVAIAAFCTYFCMYAFRKPFSAGIFEGQEISGLGFKSLVVISQLIGYMLSKFIGIKVVSEMPAKHRAIAILLLIGVAELALIGFAVVPMPLKIVMMFLNGLPLGMVFGLVLAFLEGRKQTEALSAALCASFIIASGVVKSVGRMMVENWGVSEFQMPMFVGLLFVPPLLVAVWLLQRSPPPTSDDVEHRRRRSVMSSHQRITFFRAYWPALTLMILVYVILTTVRTARDDFAVELWRDLGVIEEPSVFARSETAVAILATALNALVIFVTGNLAAIRATLVIMCGAFGLVALAGAGQALHWIDPMSFMILCGVGLYVPYVAYHTTLFERLVAISHHPGNLGFLMYLADAIGYLGYAAVLIARSLWDQQMGFLVPFRTLLIGSAVVSVLCLMLTAAYFEFKIARPAEAEATA